MVQSTVQFSHSPKPDDQFFQLTIVLKSPRASHAPSLASFLLFQLYFPSFCWAHLWFFLQEYHAIFSSCTRMYCCMTVHLNMFLLSPSVPGSTRLRFIRYATTRLMPVNQWDHFLLSSRLFHPCPPTVIPHLYLSRLLLFFQSRQWTRQVHWVMVSWDTRPVLLLEAQQWPLSRWPRCPLYLEPK